jgi:hypothetical protein
VALSGGSFELVGRFSAGHSSLSGESRSNSVASPKGRFKAWAWRFGPSIGSGHAHNGTSLVRAAELSQASETSRGTVMMRQSAQGGLLRHALERRERVDSGEPDRRIVVRGRGPGT